MPEYPCEECHMVFNMKYKYDRHIIVHTGERPFKCEFCDKAFTRKDKLNSHQLVHMPENPFKCESCEACFPRVSHLRAHIKEAHEPAKKEVVREKVVGNKMHECLDCGKIFNRRDKLVRHSTVHSNLKPFLCVICFKGFSRKDKMKAHMNIHARGAMSEPLPKRKKGQNARVAKDDGTKKQYPCPNCTWSFDYPSLLESHVRSHGIELSFKCDSCPKTFFLEVNLERHKRTHTEENRPFSCDECPKSFRHRSTLLTHKKKVHEGVASLQEHADDSDIQEVDPTILHTDSDNEDVMEYSFNPEDIGLLDYDDEDQVPTDFLELSSEYPDPEPSSDHHEDEEEDGQNYHISNAGFHETEEDNIIDNQEEELMQDTEHVSIIATEVKSDLRETGLDPLMRSPEISSNGLHQALPDPLLELSNGTSLNDSSGVTPEKLLSCEICGKEFRKRDKLTRHKRVHLRPEDQPFKCDECKKTFSRRDKYKEHMKKHGYLFNNCDMNSPVKNVQPKDEVTYGCTLCHEDFKLATDLDNHMQQSHLVNPSSFPVF